MDTDRLRDGLRQAAAAGDQFPLWFYADLFLRNPGVRDLFPVSMAAQRRHLLAALKHIAAAASAGDAAALEGYLRALGRDHYRFGAHPDHYPAVGASLLAALEHFAGQEWDPETTDAWTDAYALITEVMTAGTAEAEAGGPPWRDGTVITAARPAPGVAVLSVATDPPLGRWTPGQHVPVQVPSRPRLWRDYWIACPPAGDGLLELHAGIRGGGEVSPALAALEPGGTLRAGEPAGTLALDDSGRDIIMAGHGTGIAPLKAMLMQAAALPCPPPVRLYAAAGRPAGLYALPALKVMAARHPWLTVTPVVTGPGGDGPLHEVIAAAGDWSGCDAYAAGPADVTAAVTAALVSRGIPRERIRTGHYGRERDAQD